MTLETLIASLGVLATLQLAYRALKTMEAKPVEGPSVYETSDSFSFFETSDTEKSARRMKKDFDLARAKAIMAIAEEFADRTAKA